MGSLSIREDSVVNQVSIGGFDHQVNTQELVEFLEQEVGLIWRCRVKTTWTPPESYPDFGASVNGETRWTTDYEKVAPHAFVHFVVNDGATRALCAAATSGLFLHSCRLVVRSLSDSSLLIRRRRTANPFKLPAIDLKIGYLVSEHELLVSWTGPTSGIDFLVDPFDLHGRILFSRDVVFSLKGKREKALLRCDLKLEFSVRRIEELRFYSDSSAIVLLLLLDSAPFAFYRTADDDVFCSEPVNLLDDDDPWIRTTDFTGGAAGRCHCYRVSLSPRHGLKLSKLTLFLREQGVVVRDLTGELTVRPELQLPVTSDFFSVLPAAGVGFRTLFMVNALVHKGIINPHHLSPDFFSLLEEENNGEAALTEAALTQLYSSKQPIFYSAEKLKLVLDWLRQYPSGLPQSHGAANGPAGHVLVRRLVITPTRAYCLPAAMELSNRVLREYSSAADRFLRVTFSDEGMQRLNTGVLNYFPAAILGELGKKRYPQKTAVFRRVKRILADGFHLCGRHYRFLAFSANQLRDRSAWFFAEDGNLTVASIRGWMGRFPDRNVAKFAARMGQCFSSTVATVAVPRAAVDPFLEEVCRNGYIFSDGIGKVSPELAMEVAQRLQLQDELPSAYQIRFGGCKGVIAVWPDCHQGSGDATPQLFLRPSMKKFESSHAVIEVASWTRPQPGFLNREIVTLLSCLGVSDEVFTDMQEEMLHRLDEMLVSAATAAEILTAMCGDNGTVPALMVGAGFRPETEPHLRAMLACIRSAQLQDLRRKARIFVPKGRWFMGCLDELSVLEQGQCFIQPSAPSLERMFSRHGQRFVAAPPKKTVITGAVAIAKNPCLHPGDVRVLHAVDAPGLRHLVDCLVFPQKGERPHCNEASGSDLDGDLYFVTWDELLLPPTRRSYPPMDYKAHEPKRMPTPVSPQDIVDFFMKSMVNENLGQICHAHVVHADQSPGGATDEKCLKLAELAAQAVDFPKTGKAVNMPPELRPKVYPDFMEKPPHLTYVSEKILGHLYRRMRRFLNMDEKQLLAGENGEATAAGLPPYDKDLELAGVVELLPSAWQAKCSYDARLSTLLSQYSVAHEEELVVGHIWSLPKSQDNCRERETKERLKNAYAVLRREFRRHFMELGAAELSEEEAGQAYELKASAWYQVAYHPDWVERGRRNGNLGGGRSGTVAGARLSFPWIAADYLARIKVRRRRERGEFDRKKMMKPEDALAAYLCDRL